MRVKKVKRICSVKGCRRTDTFAITRTSEFGGVIICEACAKEAVKAIENGGVFEPERKAVVDTQLFYHPGQGGVIPALTEESSAHENGGGDATCAVCGREFKNAAGLRLHMKVHENGGEDVV